VIEADLLEIKAGLRQVLAALEELGRAATTSADVGEALDAYLNSRSLATLLDLDPVTAQRKLRAWERSGEVRVVRVGRQLRARRCDVEAYLRGRGKTKPTVADEARRLGLIDGGK
jgi:hypothetical protein